MELVQKVLAMDDSIPNAHQVLSGLYMQKKDYDQAIVEGERAVALDPGGSYAHEIYAMSLYFAGRWKEAIPRFQKAIRLNPSGSTSAYSTLGGVYAGMDRNDEAVSAFKQALLRSPDNLFAHLGLASVYIKTGKENEARVEAAEVLRINPKFTLDTHAKTIPFKDQSVMDRYIGLLRKAGLK